MMTSLGVALMYLGSLVEILDLSAAAIASLIVVVVMTEIGSYYPFAVYAATGLLAFAVLPGKSVSVVYIGFFGYYPIVRRFIEKLDKPLSTVLKFVLFNLVLVVYYFAAKLFFPSALDDLKWYFAILLNVAFFLFDKVLTLFLFLYVRQLRQRLRIDRFFR